jgi:hypothetical protein
MPINFPTVFTVIILLTLLIFAIFCSHGYKKCACKGCGLCGGRKKENKKLRRRLTKVPALSYNNGKKKGSGEPIGHEKDM